MALNLQGKRLTTFFGLKDVAAQAPLCDLDVRRNEITSFEHFGTHPELKTLHLEDNRIHSFLGMTKQKGLQELFLRGNPVALHPTYRVMALLTIGFSLQRIDGQAVVSDEREQARKLGPSAALAVSYGWLLDTTPRSAAEYDSIISELRKSRRLKEEPNPNVRTVPMVMAASDAGLSNSDGGLSITKETVELQNKALLHFAKRVAQLEHNLALQMAEHAQLELQCRTQHSGAPTYTGVDDNVNVTHLELSRACAITFDRGTAVTGPQSATRTACSITFTPESLVLRHFFTRACLADILFTDIVSSHVEIATNATSQILFGTRDGLNFDVTCSDTLTFSSIHKLLHYRVPRTLRPPSANKASLAAGVVLADSASNPAPPHDAGAEVVAATSGAQRDTRTTESPESIVDHPSAVSLGSQVPKIETEAEEQDVCSVVPKAQIEPPPSAPAAAVNSTPVAAAMRTDAVGDTFAPVASTQAPPPHASGRRGTDPVRIPSRSSSSSSIVVPAVRHPPKAVVQKATLPLEQPHTLPSSSKDSDDDSPPRPPPKRTAWRGKEIRELMIDSSDSD